MAGCREPEGNVSDKEGMRICMDVSVYTGAGCPYLPKQIPSEPCFGETGLGGMSLSQSSLPGYQYDSRQLASSQTVHSSCNLATSPALGLQFRCFLLAKVKKGEMLAAHGQYFLLVASLLLVVGECGVLFPWCGEASA